jgi:hypothetical protein
MTTVQPTELKDTWPALPLDGWLETYETLHRWTQIVGKTRLALAPMQNHWWQVTLYLSARGLTTSPIPYHDRTFEIEFDFIDHLLVVRTADGVTRSMQLAPQSVADFFRDYMAMLGSLGIEPKIYPRPVEIIDATPFADDRVHATYDADAAQRFWRVLNQADRVLKKFRSGFIGKSSPSHFWWGGFDLSCTRFSGRRAPRHEGSPPNTPEYVNVEAYSHECISAGFWPGSAGTSVEEPVFYAYAYPEPAGCPEAPVRPPETEYNMEFREWFLPYERVRTSPDPDAALMEFLDSTYSVAAELGGWNRAQLERPRDGG